MNELNAFTDLSHNAHARSLRQHEVFTDRSVKQLTAVYTATTNQHHHHHYYYYVISSKAST